MSLKTWKAEFYPKKPSKSMSTREAIEHSIQKWIGLRRGNLKKHGVVRGWPGTSIGAVGTISGMNIDTESCALCKKFFQSPWAFVAGGIVEVKQGCPKCPLTLVLGHTCDYTSEAPYGKWVSGGSNPEPMIRALKKALKKHDAGEIK